MRAALYHACGYYPELGKYQGWLPGFIAETEGVEAALAWLRWYEAW